MKIKNIIITIILFASSVSYAQNYLGRNEAAFLKYIRRVYEVEHNEGCKIYRFNDQPILITIVSVKKGASMQRAGELKALRDAGEFLKATNTMSISKVEFTKNGEIVGTPTDIIVTKSVTSIGKMEILSSFPNGERMVYVYLKKLEFDDR